MNRDYYECHITMEPEPDQIQTLKRDIESSGWKFSQIAGDINLGDGVKAYATKQLNSRKFNQTKAVNYMLLFASMLGAHVKVVRRKVELVIYDDRSSKVNCLTEDCAGCHIEGEAT